MSAFIVKIFDVIFYFAQFDNNQGKLEGAQDIAGSASSLAPHQKADIFISISRLVERNLSTFTFWTNTI